MLTVRFFRTRSRIRWWEIEDKGGWPPYGIWERFGDPSWPSDWSLRPHP